MSTVVTGRGADRATAAPVSPAPAPKPAPTRSPLRVVAPRPRGMRTPSTVAVGLLLAVGVIGLLLLNTALQRRAFELSTLNERAEALEVQVSGLTLRTDRLESTQSLALRATELGMVPNPSPVFLRLSDGRVVGDPVAAAAGSTLPGLLPEPRTITEPPRTASDAPTTTQNPPAAGVAGEDGVEARGDARADSRADTRAGTGDPAQAGGTPERTAEESSGRRAEQPRR